MDLFHQIATTVVYSGAFFALVMAVEQLARKERSSTHVVGFFCMLFNAVFSLNIAFAANGVQLERPWTSFLFITALYLSGPLNFMYYRTLLGEKPRVPGKALWHYVPPFLVFVLEVIFQLEPTAVQREIVASVFDPAGMSCIKAGIVAGALSIVSYHSYMTRELLMVRDSRKLRSEIMMIILLEGAGTVAAVVLIAGFLSGMRWLLLAGGLVFVGVNILIFLSHGRNPEFFMLLKREIRDRKYRKSMLNGVDVDALHRQLVSVMEDGLYRDYDLTLAKLAGTLGVSTHQLSQLLNQRLRMKFSDFVNRYRVEEAKRLLGTEEGRNVLSICFHVGFNSKSAFNAAFRKLTGSAPKDYRPRRGGDAVGD
jgi:AraC-like DNA-binding protein